VAEIEERGGEAAAGQAAEQDLEVTLARGLLERAERGVSVVSPEALLAGVTRTVSQAALDAEMTDHLGYEKGQRPAHAGGNHRNGTSAKIGLTEVGPIPLVVPRDRIGEFQSQIIPKHARRVEGFSEAIVSLYAKGSQPGDPRAPGRDLRSLFKTIVKKNLRLTYPQVRPLSKIT
jgi:putative transposase